MSPDPEHEMDDVLRQIAGPCEGFVADFAQHYPQTLPPQRAEVMGYFDRGFFGRDAHTGGTIRCLRPLVLVAARPDLAEPFFLCTAADHWGT